MGRLLGLASPAQFYLVRGDSAEQVLQSEEALKAQLDTLVGSGELAGFEAVSDWVPSQARQEANARLSARVETQVLARIATAVGQDVARPEFAPNALRVDAWLQQPVSQPLRARWLGETAQGWASVVTLKGLGADTNLSALQSLADKTPGVRWVNRTADISEHLGHYRYMMALLWLGGLVAVAVALYMRFRREAWRALLPTVLATALTLAALAWLGEPLQLFTVLAMLLLLGMGVDYGIFLLEHRGDGASWLAVSLGAASTLLAFGLLTLSATPALHSFGLSLLFGIGLVWLLSPLFRPGPALSPAAFELDPSALQRD